MLRTLTWMFIWFVTLVDVWFAYSWKEYFQLWELNPIAVMIYQWGGIWLVIVYRLVLLASVTLLYVIARTHARAWLVELLAIVWGVAHAALLCYYLTFFLLGV